MHARTTTLLMLAGALLMLPSSLAADSTDDLVARIADTNTRLRSAVRDAVRSPGRPLLSPETRALFVTRRGMLRGLIAENPQRAVDLLLSQPELETLRGTGVPVEEPFAFTGPAVSGVMDMFEERRAVTFYQLRSTGGERLLAYSAAGVSADPLCAGVLEASGWRLDDRVLLTAVTPMAATQCSPTGDQRVAVLMVYPPKTNKPSASPDDVTNWFFGDAPDTIRSFYRRASFGKLNVTGKAFGWYQLPRVYDCGDLLALRDDAVKLADADVDFTQFDRLHFLLPNGFSTSSCSWGGISLGGCPNVTSAEGANPASSSFSRIATNATPGVRSTATHELGHNFGLGHARTVKFPGETLGADRTRAIYDEYGDPMSIMGSGTSFQAAPHKLALQWLTPADIVVVEKSGDFSLASLQSLSGTRGLKIRRRPGADEWLWLEYRYVPDEFTEWSDPRTSAAVLHYETPQTGGYSELLLGNSPEGPVTDSDDWEMHLGGIWRDRHGPVTIELGATTSAQLAVRVRYDTPCIGVTTPGEGVVLGGDPMTLSVSAPAGCVWSADPDELWMNVSQSTGAGAGTITITPGAMPQFPRSGSITVARTVVPVTQRGSIQGSQVYRATPDQGGVNAGRTFHSDLTLLQIPGNDIRQVHISYGGAAGPNDGCSLVYDVGTRTIWNPGSTATNHGAVTAAGTLNLPLCTMTGFIFTGGGSTASEAAISYTFRWSGPPPDTLPLFVRFVNRDQTTTDWARAAAYPVSTACAVYPSSGRLKISGNANTFTITMDAADGCAWSASTPATWLRLSSAAAAGKADLKVDADKNTGYLPRTALISVAGRTVEIWQPAGTGSATTVTMLPGELEVPAAETTLVVRAQDSPHLSSIDISSGVSWIQLKGSRQTPSNGNIPATWWVTLHFDANSSGASRRGSITVGPLVYDIVQTRHAPVLISPSEQIAGPGDGIGVIRVESPDGASWSASSDQNWISFDDGGAGSGSGSLHYRVQANPGPASRTALVTVSGTTATVIQAAAGTRLETAYLARPLSGILPEDNVTAATALLDRPGGMALDSTGNLYVAERRRRIVYRIAPDGTATRVAGNGLCCYSGDGGDAVLASLNDPDVLAVDSHDRLYIADRASCVVRRVETDGSISTVAGTGSCSFDRDGSAANQTRISPIGIAIAPDDNLVIADTGNSRVRKVDGSGKLVTIAGTGEAKSAGDGDQALKAAIFHPESISYDSAGNLYIAEADGNRVRKVTGDGVISTLAGTGAFASNNDGKPAATAAVAHPTDVRVGPAGEVYVAEYSAARIRRVSADGIISTILGNGRGTRSGDGGPAAQATAYLPFRLLLDAQGNLSFTEASGSGIRRIGTDGKVDHVAGIPDTAGSGESPARARMIDPRAVAVSPSGDVYIAEAEGRRIHRIGTDGIQSVIAGDGNCCTTTAVADARKTSFNRPSGLLVHPSGELWVADSGQNRIFAITGTGAIRIVAGTGTAGSTGDNGPAVAARLNSPRSLAVDSAGSVYVADTNNCVIRRIDGAGNITTFAGDGKCASSPDGAPSSASVYYPEALAIDGDGNLLFAEASWPRKLRYIGPDGTLRTLLDTQYIVFNGNGLATAAPAGLVYADAGGRVLWRFASDRGIRPVVGSAYSTLIPDTDVPAEWLLLREPSAVAAGPNGTFFAVDSRTGRLYQLVPRF